MFGYVLPVKDELKIKDYESYRSVYCGVCKQLGQSYGVASRFLLNYDLVLLSVITDAISGEHGLVKSEGCFANPLARRKTLHETLGLRLASDGLILLSYHKLLDDIQDEKLFKRIGRVIMRPFMARLYKKAAKKYPELNEVIITQMQRQKEIENSSCGSLDIASEPTALMCGALFKLAGSTPAEQNILNRLGMFSGQIVYMLDAAEDFDQDTQRKGYNPLLCAGLNKQEAIETVQRRCRMAAGEIALCYNLLDIKQYKNILENIFFLGIPSAINAAGCRADCKQNN